MFCCCRSCACDTVVLAVVPLLCCVTCCSSTLLWTHIPPPCGFVLVQGGTLTTTKGRENINVCHAPKTALPAKELRSTKQVTHKTPQRDCPWSCWPPLGVSLMLAHASCSSHTHVAQCGQCACVSHLCFVQPLSVLSLIHSTARHTCRVFVCGNGDNVSALACIVQLPLLLQHPGRLTAASHQGTAARARGAEG